MPQRYADACATPLTHWRAAQGGLGHLLSNRVELDEAGTVRWNRIIVNAETLDRYLRESGELNPEPPILLTVDPAADCASVKTLRARMDRAEICSGKRLCGEGSD